MATHTLRLVYDGLSAALNRMPTGLEKQITAGAQEFLGAHAYFFTEGRIPINVGDRSRFFRIHDVRHKEGSWEAIFAIDVTTIVSSFGAEYTRELTKDLAADAAAATKAGFAYLIYRSYKAWKDRRPLRDRTFDRIEPVLCDTGGNGTPIFDTETHHEAQRRLLFERVSSSMSKKTAPIGRAATHLDMWFDDVQLDRIDHRFYSEDEIAEALLPLKEKWALKGRAQ